MSDEKATYSENGGGQVTACTLTAPCPKCAAPLYAKWDHDAGTASIEVVPTTHDLKCWPRFFGAIVSGEKTSEFRRNDRDFKRGDRLVLHEWSPNSGGGWRKPQGAFTGRTIERTVHSVTDLTVLGAPGYVLMEIRP